jgi:hypothetical protein
VNKSRWTELVRAKDFFKKMSAHNWPLNGIFKNVSVSVEFPYLDCKQSQGRDLNSRREIGEHKTDALYHEDEYAQVGVLSRERKSSRKAINEYHETNR